MHESKGSLARLSLAVSLAAMGCLPSPVFPKPSPAVVLALRDPLFVPEFSVLATLPGRDGPWSSWINPDSGADYLIIPSAWLDRLGAHYVDWLAWPIRLLEPPVEKGRVGVLSAITLGDLVVRDVFVQVTFDSSTTSFGQSILAHAPWEIDWDRGTLTLGATPWPDAPDISVLPLRRRGPWEVLTLQIDGHPVDMVLDTGLPYSAIPVDIGQRSGLSVHDVDRRTHLKGKEISGDAVLGPLSLGRVGFAVIEGPGLGYGNLGLDILSAYRLQVIPGERLALRPRGNAWETAPQRVARWPWTRGCKDRGCVRARLEPMGSDARVVFSFEVDHPEPLQVVLGCPDMDPVGPLLTVARRLTSDRRIDTPYHVRLWVASAVQGKSVEALVKRRGDSFFSTGHWSRCRDLSVLDVSPIDRKVLGGEEALATLWY